MLLTYLKPVFCVRNTYQCQYRTIRLGVKRGSLWKPIVVLTPKVPAAKLNWQKKAEEKFLNDRAVAPESFLSGFNPLHLATFPVHFTETLHLKNAKLKTLSVCRKLLLRERVGTNIFDTKSLAVRVTDLTEKILSIRAHILSNYRDKTCHRALSIALGRRHRAMKKLYQTDFTLYKYVCQVAKLKTVRFSIPDSRDRSRAISCVGVDGDRARFLVRQRFWRGKFCPQPIELPNNKKVQPLRHSMEDPGSFFGKPVPLRSEVSECWPYGVSKERLDGTYSLRNPTAPGKLHIPVPLVF